MNNLYHWSGMDFNRGYCGGDVIAFAPDQETAIKNILAKESRDFSHWSPIELAQRLEKIESELRSQEPDINPSVIMISGSA